MIHLPHSVRLLSACKRDSAQNYQDQANLGYARNLHTCYEFHTRSPAELIFRVVCPVIRVKILLSKMACER